MMLLVDFDKAFDSVSLEFIMTNLDLSTLQIILKNELEFY